MFPLRKVEEESSLIHVTDVRETMWERPAEGGTISQSVDTWTIDRV